MRQHLPLASVDRDSVPLELLKYAELATTMPCFVSTTSLLMSAHKELEALRDRVDPQLLAEVRVSAMTNH